MVLSRIISLISVTFLVAAFVISASAEKERYIVLLDPETTTASSMSHYSWIQNKLSVNSFKTFSHSSDSNSIQIFSVDNGLKGYTAYLEASFVTELEARPEVKLVEKDQTVTIKYAVPPPTRRAVQNKPQPNLDRLDQQSLPLDGKYNFPDTAGQGVDVYVVDTGIRVTAKEFEGRAKAGGAFCEGCPNTDDNGHGTHVAGIVGAKTFGVAKKVNLIGIKVLDVNGSGLNSDVINGLQFVLDDHNKKKNKNSIVNMSLGGPKSAAINSAVKALTDAGVHVAVAAGNEAEDACKSSPSSELSAITVAATDNNDVLAFFSNFGKCVDISAPGVNITSVGIKNDKSIQVFSGTSQATPHVAGTLALMIAESGNKKPAQMAAELLKLSSSNKIKAKGKTGTPNKLLQVPAP